MTARPMRPMSPFSLQASLPFLMGILDESGTDARLRNILFLHRPMRRKVVLLAACHHPNAVPLGHFSRPHQQRFPHPMYSSIWYWFLVLKIPRPDEVRVWTLLFWQGGWSIA